MLAQILSYPLVAIVFLLAALVFIHEFGHYIFAKLFRVGVETFSLGFGPVIFSFKAFGTLYQLAAIPLGGFVKLAGTHRGEEVPEEYKGQELFLASHWKQIVILAAGPVFNIFLAIFIYMSLSLSGIRKIESVIGVVRKESPAQKAGLLAGDKVLSVNGQKLSTWSSMSEMILKSPGKEIELTYDRKGKKKSTKVTPERFEVLSHKGGKESVGRIGIAPIFWAPIITVESKETLAYDAGLRTGDLIEGFEYNSLKLNHMISGKITAWHELVSLARKIEEEGPIKNLTLLVSQSISKKKEEEEKTKKVLLNLTKMPSNSSLLSFLGLRTSELTFLLKGDTKGAPEVLKNNDILLSFNGKNVRDIFDLELVLRENKKQKAGLTILRNGASQEVLLDLKPIERQMPSGKEIFYTLETPFLGKAKSLPTRLEKSEGLFSALAFGVKETYNMSTMMLESLWGLVVGKVPLASLGGPILIAKVASDSVKAGLDTFFRMMAIISINLAVVNLIPIPLLDGGRIVVVAIEWMRRKPLSLEALENFQKIGFVLVFSLFILATYNDLSRFWASMIRDFIGFGK